ncbi:unnamed protein product [Cochlearia groenlandica]
MEDSCSWFGYDVTSLISNDMLNNSSSSSSSELMNFDSYATWCDDSPSTTNNIILPYEAFSSFQEDDTKANTSLCLTFHDLESSYYGQEMSSQFHSEESSAKRRKVTNHHNNGFDTIPRSLSYSLDEKILKALSLFMESSSCSREDMLAQVWIPIKTGDKYLLSTCDQAYFLDQRLSQYREVSKRFMFASQENQSSFLGLPGRVFTSGVPEWTSNVIHYKKDEYLRIEYAIENQVCGSIAIPIFEAYGTSCVAVIELVTSKEKQNFDMEMDSVCRALKYFSSNQREALSEIQDVLQALCHAHKLPLALAWIPSGENCVLCIEEATCYVNDMEMEGFVHACLNHPLREHEGIVGKAFTSNKPCFSSDVKEYDISEYPLVHHARKYGLNACVAVKLKSIYTGEDNYILELFLPISMIGSLEQQLLLDDLSCTMQRTCRTLRTVSFDSGFNYARTMVSDKEDDTAVSQANLDKDMSKANKTEKKKKNTTEKNVSLTLLQQNFSHNLKDAAKNIGVCPTTLKRICRQHGITRWPSRKINKVNRSLKRLQTVLDSVHGGEKTLKFDSIKGGFVSIGQECDAHVRKVHEDVVEDTSIEILDVKYVNNVVKLEEDSSRGVILKSSSTSLDDCNQMRSHNNNESGSTSLTIKATYGEDTIRFKFKPSFGCDHLYKEIARRFKLKDGSFRLKYLDDEEEWVMMVTNSDLQECLEILYGTMRKVSIKFLVLDLPSSIGSSGDSNCYM